MRIAEARAGTLYLASERAGWTPSSLVFLLDVGPWVRHWSEGYRPAGAEDRRRVRDVPVLDVEPVVFLADGTPHVLDWGWDLGLVGVHGSGRGAVKPEAMAVALTPRVVNLALVKREVPLELVAGLTIVEVPR